MSNEIKYRNTSEFGTVIVNSQLLTQGSCYGGYSGGWL